MEKRSPPPTVWDIKYVCTRTGRMIGFYIFDFPPKGFPEENSSGYPVVHGSEGLDEMCRFWEGGLRFLGSQWECKRFDVNVRYTMQLSKFETRIGSLNGYKRI